MPEHRSHSQATTWLRCQHQYYLEKVANVGRKPALYLVSGTVIHECLETILRQYALEQLQGERGTNERKEPRDEFGF